MQSNYRELTRRADERDLVYCDPPYVHSRKILFGAQAFKLKELMYEIALAKNRGAGVVLSIAGSKKSCKRGVCSKFPADFMREISINYSRVMIKEFQLVGEIAENEEVFDRLLLTY